MEQHCPDAAAQVAAYEVVDHPTDPELVALARRWFMRYDQMAGLPT